MYDGRRPRECVIQRFSHVESYKIYYRLSEKQYETELRTYRKYQNICTVYMIAKWSTSTQQ